MENGPLHGGNEAPPRPLAHRRNLSGGLLSRLPFMRSSDDVATPNHDETQHGSIEHERALASAMRQTKTRKRKGSLRKTALLGTGKLRMENSNRTSSNNVNDAKIPDPSHLQRSISPPGEDAPASDDQEPPNWSLPPPANLTIATQHSPPSTNESPVTSPQSTYASTTDDDDGLTFSAPVTITTSLLRRRSSRATPSALPLPSKALVEHDYSETEWWGWIILIVTWLVFTIGMGSVLGVWSWAWDVGETPYAPPELEDDATLPIVGYYPALIILTGVMAWVWVVVAWVGMKYFRHARFVDGEE
jgi:hypothetical protein